MLFLESDTCERQERDTVVGREGLRPHYTADITEKGKEVKPSRKATDYGVPLGVLC